MTERSDLTYDDYADAVAIMRATLAGDEPALMALFSACDVAMTFQAVMRLHLTALLRIAEGDPEAVDRMLQFTLAGIVAMRETGQ